MQIKTILILFLLSIFVTLVSTGLVSPYHNSCTNCISNGYIYCKSDNTCRDDRPSSCSVLYD